MAKKKIPPMINDENRENLLINLALSLAEKKLRDGTASSQIITALLNRSTEKYKLENDKLKMDLEATRAKINQIENEEKNKTSYEEALNAFRSYQGVSENDEYDEYDEDWDDEYERY